MPTITELRSDTFDEAIAGDVPVLVDFWAEWCAPCRAIAPVLAEIADEQEGRLRVAKVDVEAQPEIARRLEVLAMPTLVLFRDGTEVARIRGAVPKGRLIAEVERHL